MLGLLFLLKVQPRVAVTFWAGQSKLHLASSHYPLHPAMRLRAIRTLNVGTYEYYIVTHTHIYIYTYTWYLTSPISPNPDFFVSASVAPFFVLRGGEERGDQKAARWHLARIRLCHLRREGAKNRDQGAWRVCLTMYGIRKRFTLCIYIYMYISN